MSSPPYPHRTISTPHRPTPDLRRFSALHTPKSHSPPGGSVSSTLGRISSYPLAHCCLHLFVLSRLGLWTSVLVARRKLLRDFSRLTGACCPNIGCRGSF